MMNTNEIKEKGTVKIQTRNAVKNIVKSYGEKVTRTAYIYRVEIVTLDYETFTPVTYFDNVKSFSGELSKQDIAKRLNVDVRGIRSLEVKQVLVIESLDEMFKNGIVVYATEEEMNTEEVE